MSYQQHNFSRELGRVFLNQITPAARYRPYGKAGERKNVMCPMCFNDKLPDEHLLYKCSRFLQLSIPRRWVVATKLKSCTRCLSHKVGRKPCFAVCNTENCNDNHHSLLHANQVAVEIPISNVNAC